MHRRLVVVIAVAIVVTTLAVGWPVGAQSRSVFWERWDVLIDNVDTAANRFHVTENYEIAFNGTFRYGSVVIPRQNLEDIQNVQVFEAGQSLRESCSMHPGTFCVEDLAEEISITYYFDEPITDDRQQFEIEYTVVGAIRVYEGGDQIWWSAIPSEHFGFPIADSTVTVQLPERFAPRPEVDPVVTYGVPASVEVSGTRVVARATEQIIGDEFFEIRVQYPHDSDARVPYWQANFDEQRLFEETTLPLINVGVIALSLLIGVGGILGVYTLWYTRGRDPKVGPVPEYLSEPPGELPPALVGTLLDEQADLRDVISTIIDLAHRGYIVMEENQSEGLFGIGRTRKFVFKRTDKPLHELRKFEQRIMNALFGSNRMERSLDSLKNTFYTVIPRLQDDLYQAVVDEGLFTTKPSVTRARWSWLGTALLVLAVGLGSAGTGLVEAISPALLCVPGALGLVGVIALITGQRMPAKTQKGAEEAAKWNAFRVYLQNLESYSDLQDMSAYFDNYLPYTIAFGLDRSWVRQFSQLDDVPIPSWYYPTYMGGPYYGGYKPGTPLRPMIGGSRGIDPGDLARTGDGGFSMNEMSANLAGGLQSISDGLTDMVESAARVMTSRPQSASSGSSGHWGGGGRSWSGGGFSGGGSSGGGSRGFG